MTLSAGLVQNIAAQPIGAEIPFGLGSPVAYQRHIAGDLYLWLSAYENTRRALLLGRCTALSTSFPRLPAPNMLAATNAVHRWMLGSPHAELPPEPFTAALRDVLRVIAAHGFSSHDIAHWQALRGSPVGQRGNEVAAMAAAVERASENLYEISTGTYWAWPLAKLAHLSDELGFRTQLEAAFREVDPAAPSLLFTISDVPGESQADERLLIKIANADQRLVESFLAHLGHHDREAYDSVMASPVFQAWLEVLQALGPFGIGGLGDKSSRSEATRSTAIARFCTANRLVRCEPGEPLAAALEAYRNAVAKGALDNTTLRAAQKIVNELPEAGCP